MGHKWTVDQIERTVDIFLSFPPGLSRDRACDALAADINKDPANPIYPPAVRQAVAAVRHAIAGRTARPRPSAALRKIIEGRRCAGRLCRRW